MVNQPTEDLLVERNVSGRAESEPLSTGFRFEPVWNVRFSLQSEQSQQSVSTIHDTADLRLSVEVVTASHYLDLANSSA
jgi:hypothetical protein